MVIGALVGVVVLSLANFVFYLFGLNLGLRDYGTEGKVGWLPIVFSLVIIVVAALTFVLDFDAVEQGVRQGLPEKYAWYCSFGILVGLIFLYWEILRHAQLPAPLMQPDDRLTVTVGAGWSGRSDTGRRPDGRRPVRPGSLAPTRCTTWCSGSRTGAPTRRAGPACRCPASTTTSPCRTSCGWWRRTCDPFGGPALVDEAAEKVQAVPAGSSDACASVRA